MLRVAIQIRELIASNVTSAVETASDPHKMLVRLQREIEEAIIALEGERSKASSRKKRLEASLTKDRKSEADWGDKARLAMDHDREDLARQSLLARENCRETIVETENDIAAAEAEMAEIDAAIDQLETKREETRQQAKASANAEQAPRRQSEDKSSRIDRHLDRISAMAKRAEFTAEDNERACADTHLENEVEELRRESAIDAELAKLKDAPTKPPTKRPRKKRRS